MFNNLITAFQKQLKPQNRYRWKLQYYWKKKNKKTNSLWKIIHMPEIKFSGVQESQFCRMYAKFRMFPGACIAEQILLSTMKSISVSALTLNIKSVFPLKDVHESQETR